MNAVDRAMDNVFQAFTTGPFKVVDSERAWTGSEMTFSLTAQMAFLTNRINGTVSVTDNDVTIDADLGLLSKLFPEEKVRTTVESRVRGLLT